MANRHTLSVKHLNAFEEYLKVNDWEIVLQKGEYEVLRAKKVGRKNPLIIYAKTHTQNGGAIIHCTFLDRDETVVRNFLRWLKENYSTELFTTETEALKKFEELKRT